MTKKCMSVKIFFKIQSWSSFDKYFDSIINRKAYSYS